MQRNLIPCEIPHLLDPAKTLLPEPLQVLSWDLCTYP